MITLSKPRKTVNGSVTTLLYSINIADDIEELEEFVSNIKHKYCVYGYIVQVRIEGSVMIIILDTTSIHCNEIEEDVFCMVYSNSEIDKKYNIADENLLILNIN